MLRSGLGAKRLLCLGRSWSHGAAPGDEGGCEGSWRRLVLKCVETASHCPGAHGYPGPRLVSASARPGMLLTPKETSSEASWWSVVPGARLSFQSSPRRLGIAARCERFANRPRAVPNRVVQAAGRRTRPLSEIRFAGDPRIPSIRLRVLRSPSRCRRVPVVFKSPRTLHTSTATNQASPLRPTTRIWAPSLGLVAAKDQFVEAALGDQVRRRPTHTLDPF